MRDPEFRGLVYVLLFFIALGTTFFHLAEGWTLVDSFYFTVTTLTTVGYGDLSPTTDLSKLFAAFFIIFGVAMLFGFIHKIVEHTTKRERAKNSLN